MAYLIEAMGGPDSAAVVWTEDGWLDYLYRPDHLLVRDEHWTEVAELLGAQRVGGERDPQQRGLTLLRVMTDDDTAVPDVLERVDRELGLGKATPDHILFVTPGGAAATPARPPSRRNRARTPRRGRA